MKILFIYVVLFLLSLSIGMGVDLLTETPLNMTIRFVSSIFSTTTIQESIMMVFFLALPFLTTISGALKKRKKSKS